MTDCSEREVKNGESKSNIFCQEFYFSKGVDRRVSGGVVELFQGDWFILLYFKKVNNSSMLKGFEKEKIKKEEIDVKKREDNG